MLTTDFRFPVGFVTGVDSGGSGLSNRDPEPTGLRLIDGLGRTNECCDPSLAVTNEDELPSGDGT